MDHGPWTMVYGPWSMVPWSMVYGPLSMEHGPWTMAMDMTMTMTMTITITMTPGGMVIGVLLLHPRGGVTGTLHARRFHLAWGGVGGVPTPTQDILHKSIKRQPLTGYCGLGGQG